MKQSNVLVGGIIGDALGMPFEIKKPDDPAFASWDGKTFLPSDYHKLKTTSGTWVNLQAGQYTDDGAMQIMVAESLIYCGEFNPYDIAQRYVAWTNTDKFRGAGKSTIKAIDNLKSGIHWNKSGVQGSWGNGTAMRAAPFGVFFGHNYKDLIAACTTDAQITHQSDEAVAGSIAVAIMAAFASHHTKSIFGTIVLPIIISHLPPSEVRDKLVIVEAMLKSPLLDVKKALTYLGTGCKVMETVPTAILCYLNYTTFQEGVETAIRLGGDVDTLASIVGCFYGANLGLAGIPEYFHTVEDFDRLVELDKKLTAPKPMPKF